MPELNDEQKRLLQMVLEQSGWFPALSNDLFEYLTHQARAMLPTLDRHESEEMDQYQEGRFVKEIAGVIVLFLEWEKKEHQPAVPGAARVKAAITSEGKPRLPVDLRRAVIAAYSTVKRELATMTDAERAARLELLASAYMDQLVDEYAQRGRDAVAREADSLIDRRRHALDGVANDFKQARKTTRLQMAADGVTPGRDRDRSQSPRGPRGRSRSPDRD